MSQALLRQGKSISIYFPVHPSNWLLFILCRIYTSWQGGLGKNEVVATEKLAKIYRVHATQ